MFSLANKTAFITGAGSGIGRAIAVAFAQQGARVWIADINVPSANETVGAIRAAGGRAEFVELDVSDPLAVGVVAGRVPAIDVLVNNAGIGHVGGLLETSAA